MFRLQKQEIAYKGVWFRYTLTRGARVPPPIVLMISSSGTVVGLDYRGCGRQGGIPGEREGGREKSEILVKNDKYMHSLTSLKSGVMLKLMISPSGTVVGLDYRGCGRQGGVPGGREGEGREGGRKVRY